MPANSRWDLIPRLKGYVCVKFFIVAMLELNPEVLTLNLGTLYDGGVLISAKFRMHFVCQAVSYSSIVCLSHK
jgi:hypothetical protein